MVIYKGLWIVGVEAMILKTWLHFLRIRERWELIASGIRNVCLWFEVGGIR